MVKHMYYKFESDPLSFEQKKRIGVVADNDRLLYAVKRLAVFHDAHLHCCRPHTPDILVFPGTVKIIDRYYLGRESWNAFCEYLSQVNDRSNTCLQKEFSITISDKDIYDYTPIIIVDRDQAKATYTFQTPQIAMGKPYYINQDSVELIIHLTNKLLREGSEVYRSVEAVDKVEGKRLDI